MTINVELDEDYYAASGGHRKSLLNLLGLNLDFTRGLGDFLYTADRRKIYDGTAQYGANIFGHNDPDLTDAVSSYLINERPNFIQPFYSRSHNRVAEQLTHLGGMDHCLFANSGAEAVEAALKLAKLNTRKKKILSLQNGFHGKTQLALSVSGSDRFSHPLICDRQHCNRLEAGKLENLEAKLSEGDVAAFIFEPVMGEGGMIALDPDFLRKAVALCHKYKALVIADEIQCGLYRCKDFLVSRALGLDVDIALLGKGLGGGIVPISAVLYKSSARSREFDRKHSSTFAGGGLACAVASRVVSRLSEEFDIQQNVAALSDMVDSYAAQLTGKVQITGKGLMRGIYFPGIDQTGNSFVTFASNSGLLGNLASAYLLAKHDVLLLPLLSQNCALRMEPALVTNEAGIKKMFDAISDLAEILKNGRYDILFSLFIGRPDASLPDASIPISPYNHGDDRCLPMVSTHTEGANFDFAFLAHLTQPSDLVSMFPRAMTENLSDDEMDKIVEVCGRVGQLDPAPAVSLAFKIDGTKSSRQGLILSSMIYPRDMLRMSKTDREFLLDAYMTTAQNYGATTVGLGAYTSVITKGGKTVANQYPNIKLTTGNTLTAAAINAQMDTFIGEKPPVIAVVGARGSVGGLVTLHAIQKARQLVLVGRKSTARQRYNTLLKQLCLQVLQLKEIQGGTVADRIQQLLPTNPTEQMVEAAADTLCDDTGGSPDIIVTGDHEKELCKADIIVSCTSKGDTFLQADHLKSSAVVLDAARPFDFKKSRQSNGPIILESGLVGQPSPSRIGDNNMLISQTGMALGCLSETMVLSLEDFSSDFMINQSPTLQALNTISTLAESHGFSLGPIGQKPGSEQHESSEPPQKYALHN